MKNYRKLNIAEINQLTTQFCTAEDWSKINVVEGFSPDHITHTRFSGEIELGIFEKEMELPGGLKKKTGLHHVTLHNCSIGNNSLIENIPNYIANYRIGSDCFIQNVNLILTEGESCFGNNTEVSVLNETGGREVPIYNRLSAQLAYIIAMYRHRPDLIARLREMIEAYSLAQKSCYGKIGNSVHIVNTGTIRNVCIGDYCQIDGTSRLENGSINSNREAPVYIGPNVTAEDFIVSSGAHISDGVVMSRCFIGQACHLGSRFALFQQLPKRKRRSVCYLCRPLHGHHAQIEFAHRRNVFFPERRQRVEPKQPHVQTRPYPSRSRRTGLENDQRLIYPVAGQSRCIFPHHGTPCQSPRYFGHAVFLPDRTRKSLLSRSRCESQKCGDNTRRTKVAQARQAHRPRQARLYQLQSAQSLHYTKDAAGHRHITGIETDIG